MKIWTKTKTHPEGKFLVVRRDGTIPQWPHFVLGARDPAVPLALKAYAAEAGAIEFDEDYCDSVRELAEDFTLYRRAHGDGDPPAGPHRKDNPAIIELMRGHGDLTTFSGPASARRTLPRTIRTVLAGKMGQTLCESGLVPLIAGEGPVGQPALLQTLLERAIEEHIEPLIAALLPKDSP